MSHYGGDYGGRGRREPERWDPERFNRERGGRQVIERDRFEEHERFAPRPPRDRAYDDFDYPPPRDGRGERFEEKDHFFAEERYGPPARRAPRQERYYEEEEIDSFQSSPDRGGRIIPLDRGSAARRAPPRPGIIRRQSSLDTFDRKPLPRFSREPPEVIQMPGPRRRRRSPPRYERDFEDIRIAEPDYYGDEEFRGWKEREIIIDRRRRGGEEQFEEKETIEYQEEEPFPRKGKTKMPGRLVNKRAIIELGYPFEEEGDLVIILKALGKEQIDEVISVSKEMNRGASRTTYMIEAPLPPREEEIIERREIIIPPPPIEVPRSVREWDVMSGAIGGGSEHGGGRSEHGAKSSHGGGKSSHLEVRSSHSRHSRSKSHGGHSTHGGRSHKGGHSTRGGHSTKGGHSESGSESSSSTSIEIERKSTRSKSRHRSRSTSGAFVEEIGESNAMHTGPLALVIPHREKERSERDIKTEIKELEAEKRRLKKEREHERKSTKYRDREEDEVIIERRGGKEKDVKIEKDRRASNSKLMKGMLATLT